MAKIAYYVRPLRDTDGNTQLFEVVRVDTTDRRTPTAVPLPGRYAREIAATLAAARLTDLAASEV